LIATFQGVEEQKVLVNPSISGVYSLLQSIYVIHWRANNLIENNVFGINANLSVGDYTGDVVNVNEEQEGT